MDATDQDPYDPNKPLEPGYKKDKYGRPKKKFGTKVKEFFKGKKRVEKERLQREGKLNAAGDKAVEKTEVKEKVKDDGTHKVEEVKKVENDPVDKANKIDEKHKVEKEIKPDGTEKVKETHDVDNGSRAAGNKIDEHQAHNTYQGTPGERKIDEAHAVPQHLHDQERPPIGQAGDFGPEGQVGGPNMYGLHQGGAPAPAPAPAQMQRQNILAQQNLSQQAPIQYTNSPAPLMHAGQYLPTAGHTQIGGIQGGQPAHMLPQQGPMLHQQPIGQFQPARQFDTLLPQQGIHQEVMTYHLGDMIKSGGPRAAAAALQHGHRQMNLQQPGFVGQQPGLIPQPIDALHEIKMANNTNLAAQDSTLHMHGGPVPIQQFNLPQNQANLANLQRNVNQAAGVPYLPPPQPQVQQHGIVAHPSHMKDGELMNRPLDAAPTTVFQGTGPAFNPNKMPEPENKAKKAAPVTDNQQRVHQDVQHDQQTAAQQQKAAQEQTAGEQHEAAQRHLERNVQSKAGDIVQRQDATAVGKQGEVVHKDIVSQQKGVEITPEQRIKQDANVTEGTGAIKKNINQIGKGDNINFNETNQRVKTNELKQPAPAEETKEVQFMERTPGHADSMKDKH